MKKIQAEPIHYEWNADKGARSRPNAAKCWNNEFFYGDGRPATEPSVIIRRKDYLRLLKLARASASG